MDSDEDDDGGSHSCQPSTSKLSECIRTKRGRIIKPPRSWYDDNSDQHGLNQTVASGSMSLAYLATESELSDSDDSHSEQTTVDECELSQESAFNQSDDNSDVDDEMMSDSDDKHESVEDQDRVVLDCQTLMSDSSQTDIEENSKYERDVSLDGSSAANSAKSELPAPRRGLRIRKAIDYMAMASELGDIPDTNGRLCRNDSDEDSDDVDSEFDPNSRSEEDAFSGNEDESKTTDSDTEYEESSDSNDNRQHALINVWDQFESAFQFINLEQPISGSHLKELFESLKCPKFPRRQHPKFDVEYIAYFQEREKAMAGLKLAMQNTKMILASVQTARDIIGRHIDCRSVQTVLRNVQMLCELSAIPSVENGLSTLQLARLQERWKQFVDQQLTSQPNIDKKRCQFCNAILSVDDIECSEMSNDLAARPYYPENHNTRLCSACRRKSRNARNGTAASGRA